MPKPEPAPILQVGEDGSLTSNVGPGGFRRGFADLLDFHAAPRLVRPLTPDEVTSAGFAKVGLALRQAFAQARDRFDK